jgi:hypothetical protein
MARTQNFVANVSDQEGHEALPEGLTRGAARSDEQPRQSTAKLLPGRYTKTADYKFKAVDALAAALLAASKAADDRAVTRLTHHDVDRTRDVSYPCCSSALPVWGHGLLFSGFAAPKKTRNLPPLKMQGVPYGWLHRMP